MANNTSNDVREMQTLRVIILCALVILLEGFDIQAAGVSAPRLAPFFHLQPAQLGFFLGSSAIGIFLAAILGGILADRFGRKPVIVIGVSLFGLFSLSTLLATNLATLIAARFLTGLGLGSAMPSVIALASDHSPVEMKKRAVGFIYCAIPIGGALSSVVMSIGAFGTSWRPVYMVGGLAPIVVAPLLATLLPREAKVAREPKQKDERASLGAMAGLFGDGRAATTLSLWLATFGTLLIMYLLLGWMPSLLVQMGLTRQDAQFVQMIYNLGSAIGAALAGYLLDKKLLYSTPTTAYLLLAVLLGVFGLAAFDFHAALALGFGVGAGVTTAQAVLYAFAPLCYQESIRNTGVGATVAAGRLGTIVGPLLAGTLLGSGKSAAQVLLVLIPVTLVSGLMSLLVVRMLKRDAPGASGVAVAGTRPIGGR
jgi:AAHS family 3-hydroxyphenylpropionic acid transporter